ncbi:hypothetical protein VTN49DRAFT_2532 [Thermomyces lanuginosus]|uniref:uncharacterized protein n=1 Tax=Thermomyces lanuginosus TaxID=5541 RepID=UPI003742C5B3
MLNQTSLPQASLRVPDPSARNPYTPSRSPKRSLLPPSASDPLLGEATPEAILDALSAINAVSKHESYGKNLLFKTISQVSAEDRALGARVAITAQRLREWLKEVQQWTWPTGKDVGQGKGFLPPSASDDGQRTDGEEYLGSLPAKVVETYQSRIEEIRDGIYNLNVDELKEHLLNVHIPARSRPSSSNSALSSVSAPPFSYAQLSDFTAVVTATIMRALPTLSRLKILLSTWDVRLLVLRQVPGLLAAIEVARSSLDAASASLRTSPARDEISMASYHSMKEELGSFIAEAGRRMDSVLDALEGREDCLPEVWIDSLDSIEADFATWAVEAERTAMANDWRRSQHEFNLQRKTISKEEHAGPTAQHTSLSPTVDREGSEVPADGSKADCKTDDIAVSTEPLSNKEVGPESPQERHDVARSLPGQSTHTQVLVKGAEGRVNEPAKSLLEDQPSAVQVEISKTPIEKDAESRPRDVVPLQTAEGLANAQVSSPSQAPGPDSVHESRSTPGGTPRDPSIAGAESLQASAGPELLQTYSPVALAETAGMSKQDSPREPVQSSGPHQTSPGSTSTRGPADKDSEDSMLTTDAESEPSTTPDRVLASRQEVSKLEEESIMLTPDRPVPAIERSCHQTPRDEEADYHKASAAKLSTPDNITVTPPRDPAGSRNDATPREEPLHLDPAVLKRLQSFQQTQTASLPLQRFMNDVSDPDIPSIPPLKPGSSESAIGSPRELPSRRGSESPPWNAVPRRAMRPNSTLMRSTISSLNKAVPSRRPQQGPGRPDMPANRTRHKLAPSVDLDSGHRSLRQRSSVGSLLEVPRRQLHTQKSSESMNSFVSDVDDSRQNSPLTDSFSIQPLNEADEELQEKIQSIICNIPGRIHLSSTPTYDFDQQSTVSSVSRSERPRPMSPLSTTSRSGTPSITLAPASSRSRRPHIPRNEKTVRLYHLHQRGKTNPTKLFVRSVGEDGERVMVRVGGGWADLGEYLREYVLHHGRRATQNNQVEVQDLPTARSPVPSSPSSTVTSGHSPNNRPGSPLSVRKTRSSKPTELQLHAADDASVAADGTPPRVHNSERRASVSSIYSISVSSALGDGASAYPPPPASARLPQMHSQPLGLAGPTPRSRRVSITPESEAWVEDVIDQARRSSSSSAAKPSHRHAEPRPDRELHASSRLSVRSVSDIGTVGSNRRVILKGLGVKPEASE